MLGTHIWQSNDIALFIVVFIAFDALSVNLIQSTSIHSVFDFNFSLIMFALKISRSPGIVFTEISQDA